MKKFNLFFSICILIFSLFACSLGAEKAVVQNDNCPKEITVSFNCANNRSCNTREGLRYEIEVYKDDELYKKCKKPMQRYTPTFEEFYEAMMENPDPIMMMSGKEYVEDLTEEDFRSFYDEYILNDERGRDNERYDNYITNPREISVTLLEGTYKFVLNAYGTEDFNKDILLLSGENTADVTEENYQVEIELQFVENEKSTGSIKQSYQLNYESNAECEYFFIPYDSFNMYGEDADDRICVTPGEANAQIKFTKTNVESEEHHRVITLYEAYVSDLAPGKYYGFYKFTFTNGGETYISRSGDIFDVKAGLCCSNINEFGDIPQPSIIEFFTLTLVYGTGNDIEYDYDFIKNVEEGKSVCKFAPDDYKMIPNPSKSGYVFKGWTETEGSSVETSRVYYSSDYQTEDYEWIDVYSPTYADLPLELLEGGRITAHFNEYDEKNNVSYYSFENVTLYPIWALEP